MILKICKSNTEKRLDLKKTGCEAYCVPRPDNQDVTLGKRETDRTNLQVRRRRTTLDKNGGCGEYGGSYYKEQVCDNVEISAPKRGCCLTDSLDKPYHNDFKSGGEDEYLDKSILKSCHLFDLGDLSNVYLDGSLVAEHGGKKNFTLQPNFSIVKRLYLCKPKGNNDFDKNFRFWWSKT